MIMNRFQKASRLCLIVLLALFAGALCAQPRSGVGGVATNIMDPVSVFSGFVNSGCLVIGGGFLFATILKYIEHRRSPTMVPLSTVIFLLIAGLVLVLLPLLSFVTEGGIPYTLLSH
jgi:hypothetical protein